MELKMNEYQLPEKILFNYEELKQELQEKVKMYEGLVYTDEQIKDAKADKAKLNKLKKTLNDERIRLEREYLVPFNDFKTKINEIIGIIDKPVQLIDKQVKEFDKQKKAEKLEEIKKYWNSCTLPFVIEFEKVLDNKWLNASVSMKSVTGAIDVLVGSIEKDFDTLQNLPEFAFEATEVYKSTLDINKAIQEGHRLSEIQKRKAEHEAEQARLSAEAEAKKQEAESAPTSPIGQAIESIERQAFENCMNPPVEEKETEQLKEWISFKALLTIDDAMALKEFFYSRSIQFEAI